MNKKVINPKAFDEACKKVGLYLNTTVSSRPAKGVIISDDVGNQYTITPDAKIVKVDGWEAQVIESYKRRRMVARRKKVGNKTLKRLYKRGLQKAKSTESKEKMQLYGKVNRVLKKSQEDPSANADVTNVIEWVQYRTK